MFRRISLSGLLICLLLFSQTQLVAASNSKDIGVRISPLRTYPVQAPGETTRAEIKLTNLTTKSQKVTLSSERFSVTNEDYDYAFSPVGENDWIHFKSDQISIRPNKTAKAKYWIAVPSDAPPGGYYFLVVASTKHQGESTELTEIRRVASLVYLEVSGAVKKQTQLLSFDLPWFTTRSNVSFGTRVANQGNTHDRSRISVITKYWPRGRASEPLIVEGLTLPSSVRRFEQTIKLPDMPGLYKTEASFAPPQGGLIQRSRYILYMPVWFIISLGIVLVWFGTWALLSLRNRYPKRAKPSIFR